MRRYNNLCLSLGSSQSLFIRPSHLFLASLMLCSHPWGPAHTHTHTHTTAVSFEPQGCRFLFCLRILICCTTVIAAGDSLWSVGLLFSFSFSVLFCYVKINSLQTSHWILQILLVFSGSDPELNCKTSGRVSWMIGQHSTTVIPKTSSTSDNFSNIIRSQ